MPIKEKTKLITCVKYVRKEADIATALLNLANMGADITSLESMPNAKGIFIYYEVEVKA